jgi:hypothetical protein
MMPIPRNTPDDIWRSPTWVIRKNEEVEHARTAKHDPAASKEAEMKTQIEKIVGEKSKTAQPRNGTSRGTLK